MTEQIRINLFGKALMDSVLAFLNPLLTGNSVHFFHISSVICILKRFRDILFNMKSGNSRRGRAYF